MNNLNKTYNGGPVNSIALQNDTVDMESMRTRFNVIRPKNPNRINTYEYLIDGGDDCNLRGSSTSADVWVCLCAETK